VTCSNLQDGYSVKKLSRIFFPTTFLPSKRIVLQASSVKLVR